MTLDSFGREIKTPLNELKAELAKDISETKKSTQSKDANTEQLKKINDNLENILGKNFKDELKKLVAVVKEVADCCNDISKKKSKTGDLQRQAKEFGKAVAKELKDSGQDMTTKLEGAVKDINEAFAGADDRVSKFSQALGIAGEEFGHAGSVILRNFGKDVGSIASPFIKLGKWIGKWPLEVATAIRDVTVFMAKGSWDIVTSLAKGSWNKVVGFAQYSIGFVQNLWEVTTKGVAAAWNYVTTGVRNTFSYFWEGSSAQKWWNSFTGLVSTAWSKVTGFASNAWDTITNKASAIWKGIGSIASNWIGTPLKKLFTSFGGGIERFSKNLAGKYIDPLATAAANTARRVGLLGTETEKAQKEMDKGLLGGGERKEGNEPGVGKGKARTAGVRTPMDDLCKCICRCINKLLGVTKDDAKTSKRGMKDTVKVGQNQLKAQEMMVDRLKAPRDDQADKARKYAQQEFAKMVMGQGMAARQKALAATAAAGKVLMAKPEEAAANLLQNVAQGISRTAGAVVEKPLVLLGDIIEKTAIAIPYIGGLFVALGPVIKAFGVALGGLAEGLANLVLAPLLEQVDLMSEASQAMFFSTGATQARATVQIPGMPNAQETTKQVAELDTNMSSLARTMEKFGVEWQTAMETGQDFVVIQKQQLRNFKRGIQDTTTLNKLTKIGLQTARQIGSNAEVTADLFADWHQKLGMTTTDLGFMQRGLQQIGRSTGIFGDALVQAAKAAQAIMQDMRLAGTLTTTAAKTLIELQARGMKTGTEGATQAISKIFGKGILRGNLTSQEHSLAVAGMGNDVQVQEAVFLGTLAHNTELQQRYGKNLQATLTRMVTDQLKAEQKMYNPMLSLEKNMERLSLEGKNLLSKQTEEIYGHGAEALRITAESIVKTSMSFAQRMEEINNSTKVMPKTFDQLKGMFAEQKGKDEQGLTWTDKLNKAYKDSGENMSKTLENLLQMYDLPLELRKKLEGQLSAQQKEFQAQQLMLDTGASLFEALNNTLASGDITIGQALENLTTGTQGEAKNFREYLASLGVKAKDGGTALEKALMDQATRIQKGAESLGVGGKVRDNMETPEAIVKAVRDFQKAQKGGKEEDIVAATKKLKETTDSLSRAQAFLVKEAAARTDPFNKLKDALNTLIAKFKALAQVLLITVIPFVNGLLTELENAPFWQAFKDKKWAEGFELLGQWLQTLPAKFETIMDEVSKLTNKPAFKEGLDKFIAGFMSGVAKVAKPFLEAVGKYIEEHAGDLAKSVEEMIAAFKKIDWKAVGEGVGMVVGFLGELSAIMTVGGALAVGLAGVLLLLSGPVGWVVALGAVAIALANSRLSLKEYADYVVKNTPQGKANYDVKLAEERVTDRGFFSTMWREESNKIIQIQRGFFAILRGDWQGLWDAILSGIESVNRTTWAMFEGMVDLMISLMKKLDPTGILVAKIIKPLEGAWDETKTAMLEADKARVEQRKKDKAALEMEIASKQAARDSLNEVNASYVNAVKKDYGLMGKSAEDTIKNITDYFSKEYGTEFNRTIIDSFKNATSETQLQSAFTKGSERILANMEIRQLALAKAVETGNKAEQERLTREIEAWKIDQARLITLKKANELRLEEAKILDRTRVMLDDWAKQRTTGPAKTFTEAQATERLGKGGDLAFDKLNREQRIAGLREDVLPKEKLAEIYKGDAFKKVLDTTQGTERDLILKAVLEKLNQDIDSRLAEEKAGGRKFTNEEYLNALQEIAALRNAQADSKVMEEAAKVTSQAKTPNSFYVHDVPLEKAIEDSTSAIIAAMTTPRFDFANTDEIMQKMFGVGAAEVKAIVESAKPTAVNPRLPLPVDVEEELRRRQAEAQGGGSNQVLTSIDTNTAETAAALKALIALISAAANAKGGNSRRGGGNVSIPSILASLMPFFDEMQDVNWDSANPGRSPGLDLNN